MLVHIFINNYYYYFNFISTF